MDIADARAIRTIALEKCGRPAGRDLGDRMRGDAITPPGPFASVLSVESDQTAIRGAVIAFVTERSPGGGAPRASY